MGFQQDLIQIGFLAVVGASLYLVAAGFARLEPRV